VKTSDIFNVKFRHLNLHISQVIMGNKWWTFKTKCWNKIRVKLQVYATHD